MMKARSTKTSKKDLKKKLKVWRATAAVLATSLFLGAGAVAVSNVKKADATPLYSDEGVLLADYSVEPLNDGSGRYILHVEALNDDFNVLACEISCDPDFNASEIFTFGALAQDGTSSYTNEVVSLEPGSKLYIRTTGENGSQVYTIDVPDVEEEGSPVIREIPGEVEKVSDKKSDTEETTINSVPVNTVVKTPVLNPGTPVRQTGSATSATATSEKKVVVIRDFDRTGSDSTEDTTKNTKKKSVVINKTVINKEEETVVSQKKEAVIIASYVTIDGKSLSSSESFAGKIGGKFSLSEKEFKGYRLVSIVGRTSGKYTENVENTIFVYEKESETETEDSETAVKEKENGFVFVSYVTEDGKVLGTTEIEGSAGTDYSVEEKEFKGFTLADVQGCLDGQITAGITKVTLIYTEIEDETETEEETEEDPSIESKERGIVRVSYVTDSGKVLRTTEIEDKVGNPYAAEQKEFNGFNFVKAEGSLTGTISSGITKVTLVYAEIKEDAPTVKDDEEEDKITTKENGIVRASYVTEDGTVLAETKVEGKVGNDYDIEQKDFQGYKFVRAEGNLQGKVISGITKVVLIYAEIENEEPEEPENPEHTHEYVVINSGEPTCETDGFKEYGCSCGDTYVETIPAFGHDYTIEQMTESEIVERCKNCGKTRTTTLETTDTDNTAETEEVLENSAETDTTDEVLENTESDETETDTAETTGNETETEDNSNENVTEDTENTVEDAVEDAGEVSDSSYEGEAENAII